MRREETLGFAIKMQLLRIGKTQKWLANEVGVSENHLTMIATNKSVPSISLLARISKAIDVDIGELVKYVA